MKLQPWMIPGDLAPGDKKSAHADMSHIELHRITSADDPLFKMAFDALWKEFGHSGELEPAEILAARLRRNSQSMRYEMILLTSAGEFAAACDHTVFVQPLEPLEPVCAAEKRGKGILPLLGENCMPTSPLPLESPAQGALVHISHNLVAPAWRRTGLAGWLRAISVTSGREHLASLGFQNSPVTVIGEVEYLDHSHAGNIGRLHAYEKAGYKKIDPSKLHYCQPDFRPHDQIDREGKPSPVPLCLVIRRVGCEEIDFITGGEIRQIVGLLYQMFAMDLRPQDMECVYESLNAYPASDERIGLVPPTAA